MKVEVILNIRDLIEYILNSSSSLNLEKGKRIFNKNVKNSSGVIRVHISNNSYLWERLTLTNIFDENKNIIRTVGVIENVTEEKENELSLFLEKQYCEALQTDNIYTYEINLSKNTINLLNKSSKIHVLKYSWKKDFFIKIIDL